MLREWCKRLMRALASTAVFVHPSIRAAEEAEKAARDAEEAAERAAAKAAKAAAANGDSSDNSGPLVRQPSSSSGSSYHGGGDLLPVSLPTAMYLPPGARPRPAMPPPGAAAGNGGFGAGGGGAFGAGGPGLLRTAASVEQPGDGGYAGNGFSSGIMANPVSARWGCCVWLGQHLDHCMPALSLALCLGVALCMCVV